MEEASSSLVAWLNKAACSDVLGNSKSRGDSITLVDNYIAIREFILSVGIIIFSLDFGELGGKDANYHDVLCKISANFDTYEGGSVWKAINSSVHIALEALLLCAVGESCSLRNEFILSIIELDSVDQGCIMGCIRRNMSNYVQVNDDAEMLLEAASAGGGEYTAENNGDDGNMDNVKIFNSEFSMIDADLTAITEGDSIYSRRNNSIFNRRDVSVLSRRDEQRNHNNNSSNSNDIADMNTTCDECEVNNKLLGNFSDQMLALSEELEQTKQNWRGKQSLESQKKQDLEVELMEKLKAHQNIETSLSQAAKQLQVLVHKILQDSDMLDSIAILKEEIEELKPQAKRSFELEEAVETLRNRLDDMSNIKSQLSFESSDLSKTLKRLHEAEDEREALRGYEPQLETYRLQYAELVISSKELSHQLHSQAEDIKMLKADINYLNGGRELTSETNRSLNLGIAEADNKLREVYGHANHNVGIGAGLCELNPEIVEEIAGLVSKNDEYRRLIDPSNQSRFKDLKKSTNEQVLISTSLQSKLSVAKEEYNRCTSKITALERQIYEVKTNFNSFVSQAVESDHMFQEEMDTQKSYRQSILNHDKKRKLTQISLSFEARSRHYSEMLNEIASDNNTIRDKNSEIDQLDMNKRSLVLTLNEKQADHAALVDQGRIELENFHEKIERITSKFLSEADVMKLSYEEEVSKRQFNHDNLIQIQRARQLELESDIEDNKSKRRKLEREKRIADAEIQRYKGILQQQAQSSSSERNGDNGILSFSGDASSIFKELKAMQNEIGHYRQENEILRKNDSVDKDYCGEDMKLFDNCKGLIFRHPINSNVGGGGAGSYQGGTLTVTNFLEMHDSNDRQVQQLMKEKRVILAKILEENKECIEYNQKLLIYEREIASMNAKLNAIKDGKLILENCALKAGLLPTSTNAVRKSQKEDMLI